MQIKLTTTGRRSGRDRTVTLYGWEDGKDLLVVGSWAGRERDPDWAGNLRAEPKASVTRGKESFEVTAHELSGTARQRAWELVVGRFPMYATYQRKTTRQIPVFALHRR
jgi:deazaflavin-dependent oxidoreductase (nitroreductase family)